MEPTEPTKPTTPTAPKQPLIAKPAGLVILIALAIFTFALFRALDSSPLTVFVLLLPSIVVIPWSIVLNVRRVKAKSA